MIGVPAQFSSARIFDALEATAVGIVNSIPRVLSGIIFLAIAAILIKVILMVVRRAIGRAYPKENDLVIDLAVLIISVFLWFGTFLTLLEILGMGQIAASLGTAAGFVALGVSYALSNMIADTVAGVYLLRDPDFNPGDRVTAESVTGSVVDIGLRKCRFQTDEGDLVVMANRDVDKRWTQRRSEPGEST